MKIMTSMFKKKRSSMLLMTALFFFISETKGRAQSGCFNVDLQAVAITPDISETGIGKTFTIFVTMKNNGPCIIPVGEATAQITIDSNNFRLGNPINFIAECDQWTYLGDFPGAGTHNLFFRNNRGPIPVSGPFCGFKFNVKGKASTGVPSIITLTSSLHKEATTSDGYGNNQSVTANVSVSVTGSGSGKTPPVIISDFKISANNCNAILNWVSSRDSKVDSFIVEHSANGIQFAKLGEVVFTNTAAPVYEYINDQGNGKGYYRVGAKSKDGRITYSIIQSIDTKCIIKKGFVP